MSQFGSYAAGLLLVRRLSSLTGVGGSLLLGVVAASPNPSVVPFLSATAFPFTGSGFFLVP